MAKQTEFFNGYYAAKPCSCPSMVPASLRSTIGQRTRFLAVEPGRELTVPMSYELDSAPECERFILVASHSELSMVQALSEA